MLNAHPHAEPPLAGRKAAVRVGYQNFVGWGEFVFFFFLFFFFKEQCRGWGEGGGRLQGLPQGARKGGARGQGPRSANVLPSGLVSESSAVLEVGP